MRKRKQEAGFTLLEIALVILIAGMLIGAVLNSRGIQDAARSLRLQKQVEELRVAVDLYVDRIGEYPGSGNAPATGVWEDDLVEEDLVTSTSRATNHAFGDSVSFDYQSATANHPFTGTFNIFQYDNIPAKWARSLISTFEDAANPELGDFRATQPGSVGTPLDAADLDTEVTSGNNVFLFIRI